MKKVLTSLVFCMLCLASFAQQYVTIDQIRAGWAKRTITGVKDGNILTLVTAFNKTWHTRPATELLKHPVTTEDGDAYNIVVDRPNGYVSAYELGDDGESFEACVWKRNNGHKLFAFVFQRMYGLSTHQVILFYDYDPAAQKLTPEQNELTRYTPSFNHKNGVSGLVLTFHLPQHGKDVIVKEYLMNWYSSIEHVFEWDGTNHHFARTNIENFKAIRDPYDEIYGSDYENTDFTKYMLYDFDKDGEPELWLSSDNEDYQAIYSMMEGKIDMLAATYYKTSFIFYPTAIGTAGSCGTGCFAAQYTILKNSKGIHTFEDNQEWNFQKDAMDHTYTLDGKELSQKAGEQYLENLGKSKNIAPKFRPLSRSAQ